MADKPIALVTGGGGGIGAACARRLSESSLVVIADLVDEAARAVAEELGGIAVALDIGISQDVENAVERIESEIGPIDKLVHAAGVIQDRAYSPEEFDQEKWDLVQTVNTRGTWAVARAVGSRMAKRHRGSIVTISSLAGHRGWPTHSYAASKAAVLSLSRGLAVEWGRSGVRVNSVSPGFTLTPKLEELIKTRDWDTGGPSSQSALGRWISPDEVADAVAYLLSDQASGVTGIDLPVDAGWLAGINWLAFNGIPNSR